MTIERDACISATTMLLSVLEFVCLSCGDNQTKQREDTEKKGMKEEGNEKSVTWKKEATASLYIVKHVQTARIFGQVRSLAILYIGSLCFANTNAIATNFSFSDSSLL